MEKLASCSYKFGKANKPEPNMYIHMLKILFIIPSSTFQNLPNILIFISLPIISE